MALRDLPGHGMGLIVQQSPACLGLGGGQIASNGLIGSSQSMQGFTPWLQVHESGLWGWRQPEQVTGVGGCFGQRFGAGGAMKSVWGGVGGQIALQSLCQGKPLRVIGPDDHNLNGLGWVHLGDLAS